MIVNDEPYRMQEKSGSIWTGHLPYTKHELWVANLQPLKILSYPRHTAKILLPLLFSSVSHLSQTWKTKHEEFHSGLIKCKHYYLSYSVSERARGGAVGWGTVLQAGRLRSDFFIDIILSAALWPCGWLSL